MTVSSTNTQEFTIGKIVSLAFKIAGLTNPSQTPNAANLNFGYDLLELTLKGLTTQGLLVKKIEFQLVTLVAGQYIYPLAAGVADVVGAAMYIEPGMDVTKAPSETPVRQIAREEWQSLSSKDAASRPTLYYVHRTTDGPSLYFWPIPSATEDAGSVRIQANLWRADANDGNATADVERYWEDYLVWKLAHDISVSSNIPADKCAYLMSEAEKKLLYAKAYAMDRPDQQAVVDHPTGYGRLRG